MGLPYSSAFPGAVVTSTFGWREEVRDGAGRVVSPAHFHSGLDLGDGRCGSAVVSPADGIVRFIGHAGDKTDQHPRGMAGLCLFIEHLDGWWTILCHLEEGSPGNRVGDSVRRGEPVARCGRTGASTACHLHQELQRPFGTHHDPAVYLARGELPVRVGGNPSVIPSGGAQFSPLVGKTVVIPKGTNLRNDDSPTAPVVFLTDKEYRQPAFGRSPAESVGPAKWYLFPIYANRRWNALWVAAHVVRLERVAAPSVPSVPKAAMATALDAIGAAVAAARKLVS